MALKRPERYVALLDRRYTLRMPVDSEIEERRGEAFELDAPLTVIGRKLRPGAAVTVNNAIQPGNNPKPRPEDS